MKTISGHPAIAKGEQLPVIDAPNASLFFIKEARTAGQPVYLYGHKWSTGFQELVFTSHAKADQFARENHCRIERPMVHAAIYRSRTCI